MTDSPNVAHFRMVDEFMLRMRREHPEAFSAVCLKHPVVTAKMQRRIRRSERRLDDYVERDADDPMNGYDE